MRAGEVPINGFFCTSLVSGCLPWVHHGRAQFHLGMQTTSALPIEVARSYVHKTISFRDFFGMQSRRRPMHCRIRYAVRYHVAAMFSHSRVTASRAVSCNSHWVSQKYQIPRRIESVLYGCVIFGCEFVRGCISVWRTTARGIASTRMRHKCVVGDAWAAAAVDTDARMRRF